MKHPRFHPLVRHLAASISCTVLVLIGIRLAGGTPHVAYFLALAVVVAVASVALRRVGETLGELRWPPRRARQPTEERVDGRVIAIEAALRRGTEDPALFASRLQPLLTDLARHGLRHRHGIEMARQPEQARAMLGAEAWDLLTMPPEGPIRLKRIEAVVAAIERL